MAVSDPSGTLATPYEVVARSGDLAADHRRLTDIAEAVGAEVVVVGLPLSLSGEVGRAAASVLDEVAALREVMPVPVETHDERLTTVSADRSMMERHMNAQARRRVVDKVAAAVMLQSWLDARGAPS